jgi:beta-1,4-mannosyl-glycoprotein beta-1,4-N-acetylglucosaminyltransferase
MIKRIVDCFIFFNELDLLEIRLRYLYNSVDYFIIVEANKTFSGQDKDFILQANMDRYEFFKGKIIYIPVEMRHFSEHKRVAWKRERFQRNCIEIGIKKLNLHPYDLILISDIDELPNKQIIKDLNDSQSISEEKISTTTLEIFPYVLNTVLKIGGKVKKYPIIIKLLYYILIKKSNEPTVFRMYNFHYFLNYKEIDSFWPGVMCVEANFLKRFSPQDVRNLRNFPLRFINNAGWHFTFLGGKEKIKDKLRSFSHQEYNIPEIMSDEYIDFCIKNGLSLYESYKNKSITTLYEKYEISNFPEDLREIISSYKILML